MNSAMIMAAVPQYRSAWNRRRKTRERRIDLVTRILCCESVVEENMKSDCCCLGLCC